VLHGLGDADLRRAVLQCHLDAVDGAMRYLGAHAVVARRRSAGLGATVLTGGPVAARFTHGTSRAGDPHLHSHVVVANLAHGSDGRWSTTDSRALYAHRNAAGALYDAHLRDSLRRGLGVSWERVGAGRYDIVGIPRAVRGEFSSRSAEIRSELATVGRPSRSRRTAAWASTREPKGYVGDDAQRAGWADRVEALGLEPKDLAAVVPTRADPGNTARPDGSLDEVEFAQLLGRSADGVVTRRAVVEAWARASPDGASAVQIDAAAEVWAPTHGELGVSERPTASGAMVLSAAVLERLGPRPSVADGQARYAAAASGLTAYRRRWGLEGERGVPTQQDRAAMPVKRLLEHLECERAIDEAHRATGRTRVAGDTIGRAR
jgi:hypothetical protein